MAKRTALALKVGISSDQLASYEFGRVPLPWAVGDRICELFDVSQAWLATGEGGREHYYQIQLSEPGSAPLKRERFSIVYEKDFRARLQAAQKEARAKLLGPDGFLARTKRIVRIFNDPSMGLTPKEAVEIDDILAQMVRAAKRALRKTYRRPPL